MDERGSKRDFLRHTGGVVSDSSPRCLGEVHSAQQIGGAFGDSRLIKPMQVSGVCDELFTREPIKKMHPVREHPQVFLGF